MNNQEFNYSFGSDKELFKLKYEQRFQTENDKKYLNSKPGENPKADKIRSQHVINPAFK